MGNPAKGFRKIVVLLLAVFGCCVFSSCIGLGFGDLPKPFTAWSSGDGILSFETQGCQYDLGMGTLSVNGEDIEVAVLMDVVTQHLDVYRQEDIRGDYSYVTFLRFHILTYKSGFLKVEQDRIKLTTDTNDTGDPFFDAAEFDLLRTDLDPDRIDAGQYAGTSWDNGEYGMTLSSNLESDFTRVISGRIQTERVDLEIQFRFLENHRFEVTAADEVVLAGSYATEGLSLRLNVEYDGVYGNLSALVLEGSAR